MLREDASGLSQFYQLKKAAMMDPPMEGASKVARSSTVQSAGGVKVVVTGPKTCLSEF